MKAFPRAELRRDLAGVVYVPAAQDPDRLGAALHAEGALVALKVRYGGSDPERAPWLVAARPFPLGPDLTRQLERLGAAVFALCDTAQDLYAEGDPHVRAALDIGVPEDLRGRDLDRRIELFRLDVVVSQSVPRVTEIEEAFGNVGKMHAFERAYGVGAGELFRAFHRRGIERIWMDDQYPTYRPENELAARRMREQFCRPVDVEFFSRFRDDGRRGWRFCYVKELRQYGERLRREIFAAAERLINPLFHGFGTKALLSLVWDPVLESAIAGRLGAQTMTVLRTCVPRSQVLPARPDPALVEQFKACGREKVLKVIDSDASEFTWGSRGVFFGDHSAGRWRSALDAAAAGQIPGRPEATGSRFVIGDLVESDRFDVEFLHPHSRQLCLLPRARIRLTPIYAREGHGSELLGGHTTFVNTSRKVHLGHHAVCTPFVPSFTQA
ncbi:hypothetical protein ACFPH6_01550 [Streptomyces xiangluensis]|uniref:Pyoverdine/dityrosine biosynthesis protein n=1 Tax=Streptomyces xiangluensis TaxID=2665720 RepID=A0ABV8YGW3_9ACTN